MGPCTSVRSDCWTSPQNLEDLLDHCVPRPLRRHFFGHEVHTTYERGWATWRNGDLISAAESEGFDVIVTTDLNIPHQQTLTGKKLPIVILIARSNSKHVLIPLVPQTLAAIAAIQPGQIVHVGG